MNPSKSEPLNQVAEILGIANAPLTMADVRTLVNLKFRTSYTQININDRVGWLVRKGDALRHHHPSGVLRYSLKGSKAAAMADTPAPVPTASRPARVYAPGPVIAPVRDIDPASVEASTSTKRAAWDEKSTIEKELGRLESLPAPSHSTHEATLAAVTKPCGLRDRCDAVRIDIEDLVGDALDLKIDHSTIKALFVAQAAILRAQQAMAA